MDLIDEEDVVGLQVGQDGRKVAGAFEGRPRGHPEVDALLDRDDPGQGGLSQAWRAREQNVVQRPLADELAEMAGAQGEVVVVLDCGAEQALLAAHPLASLCRAALTCSSIGSSGSRSLTTALISEVE
jgi:hypothetical protein